ncbi:MAG: ATP-binding protein [Bacteroidales bacterium]|jgi:predicted AAA+ superfamily ATPase|nr:ATP-binding protein [Bacteroidales bacterium]
MINRTAEKRLKELYSIFKVIAITGPRQSGKTTLVKSVFPLKPYINLENPDTRQYSIDDPRGFLSQYPDGAILDEAQRSPLLFSYLQEIVDNNPHNGQFILTGSNNFLLNENISQSLAGRVGYLNLLPFSFEELYSAKISSNENEFILQGFYPPLYDRQILAKDWIPNYIKTYIERDVRQIKNITDLLVFERFMSLLAGRTGQEINYSSLSVEAGVDVKTIQSWIGILESSFIIYLLKPYYKNYNKTIVKRPKLYFYDTAIACSLLRIYNLDHIVNHPLRGALFECLIVSEMIKKQMHQGMDINLYYWRDKTGREIDLLIDEANQVVPVEIKAGKTIHNEFFKNIRYWLKLSGEKSGKVIYAGDSDQKRSEGIDVISWKNINKNFNPK